MWQQGTSRGFRMDDTEPAEREESGIFLSFAKRSREVHRRPAAPAGLPPPDLYSFPPHSQCGEELWDKILRQPSQKAAYCDSCCRDPLSLFSREPAEKLWTGVMGGPRDDDLSLNALPSPAQLMGRRKRGGGRVQSGDAAQRQAAAVTQHIGDLRRKQSAVEQIKKKKWWGTTLGYTREKGVCFDMANLRSLEAPWSSDPFHTHPNTPQVFTGGEEEVMDLAPGANPMMSFVVAGTAHREAEWSWDTPCVATPCVATPSFGTPHVPCAELWGFPSDI